MTPSGRVVRVTKNLEIPSAEIRMTFSRSGGPGGQHVNKVETGVLLSFDVAGSPSLNESQRWLILSRLKNRIDKNGILHLTESGERSQWRNRERILERLGLLLETALKMRKTRVRTGPPRKVKEERLQSKSIRAGRKASRRKPLPDSE